jgi:SAM-dependent methyltransferase
MSRKELLIGCGSSREKKIYLPGQEDWNDLITLDINANHKPDVVFNLNDLILPFEENSFDEIHAYEVLEHTGQQGDYRFFFAQFEEFYRILKPKGKFFATVPTPTSPWAWGDPSHTRIFCKEWLTFLRQKSYEEQVGVTSLSDFRYIYKADFEIILAQEQNDTLYFIVEANKK